MFYAIQNWTLTVRQEIIKVTFVFAVLLFMFNFKGKSGSCIRRAELLHLKAIWNLLGQLSSDFNTERVKSCWNWSDWCIKTKFCFTARTRFFFILNTGCFAVYDFSYFLPYICQFNGTVKRAIENVQLVLRLCCKTSELNSDVARSQVLPATKTNLATLFGARQVWTWVVKRATSLFNWFCSNVACKTSSTSLPVLPYLKSMREIVGDFYSLSPIHMIHLYCSLEFYSSSAIEVSSLFWDRRVRLARLGRKIATCKE